MTEKEIPLDKIEAGMELACDVVNKYKQVLIKANTKFEEQHRFLLKTWGIKSILVKSVGDSENSINITEEQKAGALVELKKRMLWNPRNEIEEELMEIAIVRISQKISVIK